MDCQDDESVVSSQPLSRSERESVREEYGRAGGDERVVRLLEQLERAEAKLAQQAQHMENMEARLTRRH